MDIAFVKRHKKRDMHFFVCAFRRDEKRKLFEKKKKLSGSSLFYYLGFCSFSAFSSAVYLLMLQNKREIYCGVLHCRSQDRNRKDGVSLKTEPPFCFRFIQI